jgi:hypothetical protein
VVNLTSAETWRAPVHELIPIGPLQIKVKTLPGGNPKSLTLLASDDRADVVFKDGWAQFALASVLDHEVALIE